MEWKHVKVAEDQCERAAELVAAVSARTLGELAGARWSMTGVIRLALDWGLGYIEGLIENGLPLEAPSVPAASSVTVGSLIRYRDGESDSDGRVLAVRPGGRVLVAWDGEVKTEHAAAEVAGWLRDGFVHAPR